jgi:hypothetical protein
MRVVMVVMPVMMMPMVVVMGHRFGGHWRRPFRGAGYCSLREGIAGEAERKRGGYHKGLDHGEVFLWLR